MGTIYLTDSDFLASLFASQYDLRIDAEHRNQDTHYGKDGKHTEQGIFGSEELVVLFFDIGYDDVM